MSIFEKVVLTWEGRQYTIPPTRILQCIAKIEEVITLVELNRYVLAGTAPLARLAQAYGAVLRHAGANVADDEVYVAMFSGSGQQERAAQANNTLLLLMVPQSAIDKATPQEGTEGKAQATSPTS